MSRKSAGYDTRQCAKKLSEVRKRCEQTFGELTYEPEVLEAEPLFALLSWFRSRLDSLYEAVRLLIHSRYTREAAILTLAMLETVTDILYIDDDVFKAKRWLLHSDPIHTPVKMWPKLEALHLPSAKVEFYKQFYQFSSMIKHGNPVARGDLKSVRLRPWKRYTGTWAEYLSNHRFMIDVGMTTEEQLKGEWRHWREIEASSHHRAKEVIDEERQVGDFVLSTAGVLLADAFERMAEVFKRKIPKAQELLDEDVFSIQFLRGALRSITLAKRTNEETKRLLREAYGLPQPVEQ